MLQLSACLGTSSAISRTQMLPLQRGSELQSSAQANATLTTCLLSLACCSAAAGQRQLRSRTTLSAARGTAWPWLPSTGGPSLSILPQWPPRISRPTPSSCSWPTVRSTLLYEQCHPVALSCKGSSTSFRRRNCHLLLIRPP